MMPTLAQAFANWIADGGRQVGEIHIETAGNGFVLCHRDEMASGGAATPFTGPEAARELCQCDDAGKFRPLKSAPNLRHGWRLDLANLAELRRALDYFYPGMMGIWASHRRGTLTVVPLRDTLARQSGMYAVTKKISDAQAETMIGSFCRTDGGCLKRILWPIAPGIPVTSLPAEKFAATAPAQTLPLLCHEACNLLVAQARVVVKKAEAPA
jgi:sirohydrochlorin cobaltochelatase